MMLMRDSVINHPFRMEIEETSHLIYVAWKWNYVLKAENHGKGGANAETDQVILTPNISSSCREPFLEVQQSMEASETVSAELLF